MQLRKHDVYQSYARRYRQGGLEEHLPGIGQAQGLGRGPEIDHQFVFGRRLHRTVARLLAAEDAIGATDRKPVR